MLFGLIQTACIPHGIVFIYIGVRVPLDLGGGGGGAW